MDYKIPFLIIIGVFPAQLGNFEIAGTPINKARDAEVWTFEKEDSDFIITPFRVTEEGYFLSHDLSNFHSNPPWVKKKSSRAKRSLKEDRSRSGLSEAFYIIPIQGKNHMIKLEPNQNFVSPSAVIERRFWLSNSANGVYSTGSFQSHATFLSTDHNCHFVGNIINQTASTVALSTCNGLKGFVRVEEEDFLIEPLMKKNVINGKPHPHRIYRRSTSKYSDLKRNECGSKGYTKAISQRRQWELSRKLLYSETNKYKETYSIKKSRNADRDKIRAKRSVSVESNVEILVVADKQMIDFYANDDITTYILTVMNMVSTIYHDASLGNAVNIVVVRIILLESPQYEKHLNVSHKADETLSSFCQWQQTINPIDEDHPHHHDLAVLLTKQNICSRSNAQCTTLGLAEIAGMCQPHRSCNVNEDNGLQIAYTVAHEIGHNFGMNHDSTSNGCGSPYGLNYHVMSPHLLTSAKSLTWSNCSRAQITKFLDRKWGKCLMDEPEEVAYSFPVLPPGAMYDADHQCRLSFGPKAEHCRGIELECQTLWCRLDTTCVTRLEPMAEGTKCGRHKWCYNGECVPIGERPIAIHGGWGLWTPWGECSRSCGAGVSEASRSCNNPSPANGGRYCTGNRKRYRICNTQDCPLDSVSFRAMQCSKFNNQSYLGKMHKWRPVIFEGHPCQLDCKPDNEYFSVRLRDNVIDGTPCRPGSHDLCIHGTCKPVACDWTIEGEAQEDRCGLCHGDGTQCVTHNGLYDETPGIGYFAIIALPTGAKNTRIQEIAPDTNYLAVRDAISGLYYLNGNRIIQWSGEYNALGVMMYYKRDNGKESIFMPGPLTHPLIIMVFFQTKNSGINWEYTMPHENITYTPEFHWYYTDWSVCSRTCGNGTQYLAVQCRENEAGLVDDGYCIEEKKPPKKSRPCNTHSCPSWWWTGPWQPCSVTCGTYATRKRTAICVRSYSKNEQMALFDSDCSSDEKPHLEEICPDLQECPNTKAIANMTCSESSADNDCSKKSNSTTTEDCENEACGHWESGSWGDCSSTCGEGVQIRSVICINGTSCLASEEPPSVKECKISDCSSIKKENAPFNIDFSISSSDLLPNENALLPVNVENISKIESNISVPKSDNNSHLIKETDIKAVDQDLSSENKFDRNNANILKNNSFPKKNYSNNNISLSPLSLHENKTEKDISKKYNFHNKSYDRIKSENNSEITEHKTKEITLSDSRNLTNENINSTENGEIMQSKNEKWIEDTNSLIELHNGDKEMNTSAENNETEFKGNHTYKELAPFLLEEDYADYLSEEYYESYLEDLESFSKYIYDEKNEKTDEKMKTENDFTKSDLNSTLPILEVGKHKNNDSHILKDIEKIIDSEVIHNINITEETKSNLTLLHDINTKITASKNNTNYYSNIVEIGSKEVSESESEVSTFNLTEESEIFLAENIGIDNTSQETNFNANTLKSNENLLNTTEDDPTVLQNEIYSYDNSQNLTFTEEYIFYDNNSLYKMHNTSDYSSTGEKNFNSLNRIKKNHEMKLILDDHDDIPTNISEINEHELDFVTLNISTSTALKNVKKDGKQCDDINNGPHVSDISVEELQSIIDKSSETEAESKSENSDISPKAFIHDSELRKENEIYEDNRNNGSSIFNNKTEINSSFLEVDYKIKLKNETNEEGDNFDNIFSLTSKNFKVADKGENFTNICCVNVTKNENSIDELIKKDLNNTEFILEKRIIKTNESAGNIPPRIIDDIQEENNDIILEEVTNIDHTHISLPIQSPVNASVLNERTMIKKIKLDNIIIENINLTENRNESEKEKMTSFLNQTMNEFSSEQPYSIAKDEIEHLQLFTADFENKELKKSHKNDSLKKFHEEKIYTNVDANQIMKFANFSEEEKSIENNGSKIITDGIFDWVIGNWSECTENCGGGNQRRPVECQDTKIGTAVDPHMCQSVPPINFQTCNLEKCLNWITSDFGPCSSTCDKGFRLRNVSCPIEGRCSVKNIPKNIEKCPENLCVSWVEGPWSMCTKSCGGGYQIRFVKCKNIVTKEFSGNCTEAKPPNKRPCNVKKCPLVQNFESECKNLLDSKLCAKLIHMCETKFFRAKCCESCNKTASF